MVVKDELEPLDEEPPDDDPPDEEPPDENPEDVPPDDELASPPVDDTELPPPHADRQATARTVITPGTEGVRRAAREVMVGLRSKRAATVIV